MVYMNQKDRLPPGKGYSVLSCNNMKRYSVCKKILNLSLYSLIGDKNCFNAVCKNYYYKKILYKFGCTEQAERYCSLNKI